MSDKQPETQIVVLDDYVAPPPPESRALAQGEVPSRAVQAAATMGVGGNAAVASSVASAMATVELQMKMAMSFPRQPDQITAQVYQSCSNPEFAATALYSFPQGKTTITGPSIKLAEEIARHWGNINSGYSVVMDDVEQRTVRAYAWDMQTNVRREMEITFAKLVQRKRGAQTDWVTPNEKELQQLTSAKAGIAVRNMLLAMLPDQLKRDAVSWCRQTLATKDAQDPDFWRKKLVLNFSANLGVPPDVLRDLVGKDLGSIRAPADQDVIEYLRGVYNRIDRGEATVAEIVAERAEQLGVEGPAPATAAELRKRVSEAATTARSRRS